MKTRYFLPMLMVLLSLVARGEVPRVKKVSNDTPTTVPSVQRKPVIVIDPGHGGYHKGGGNFVDRKRVWEKEVTLQIAFRIEKIAKQDGRFDVKLTRRDDTYVGLAERTRRAENFGGDIFVSLHTNAVDGDASRKSRARGLEFWTWSPDGSRTAAAKWLEDLENDEGTYMGPARPLVNQMMIDALTMQALESRRVARALETAFLRDSQYRANYRGIDGARFKVLENYAMPSVLIEYGFITHPEEVRRLSSPRHQEIMAQHTFDGIASYLTALRRDEKVAMANAER